MTFPRSLPRLGLIVGLLTSDRVGSGQVIRVGVQPTRAQQQLALNTMTVTSSPSTVNFTLGSRQASTGSAPVSITTSWLLGVASTVRLYGYFSSSAALSSTGGDGSVIPASSVLGQCPTGSPTSLTPFTQAGPFSGSTSLLIFQQSAVASALVTRTDQLSLTIDLSSLPQLPAGSYSGTLILQAQAM